MTGEKPEEANVREIKEESEIDLTTAKSVRFAGLVTWDVHKDGTEPYLGGMYTYIAEFDDANVLFGVRETREGKLEWKNLHWVIDKSNEAVVDNIPHFLPIMLEGDNVCEYRFIYKNGSLERFEVYPLNED